MKQSLATVFGAWLMLLGTPSCEAPAQDPPPVCGDGVLAPEAGELVETNYDACTAAGHFGGVSVTEDCLTLSERYCGDYRLLSTPASVKFPVLTHDSDGAPWLAGIVQGDFDGPTCDRERLIWTTFNIDEGVTYTHEDGYHYADCDRTFFGRLGDTQAPEVTLSLDDATPPQAILSLGAAGFAMVRHHPDPEDLDFKVDWISPQGTLLHTETVRHQSGRVGPQLVRNGDDEFALVTSTRLEDILWISRFSIVEPGLIQTSVLTTVEHEGEPWGADYYSRPLRILGVSPGIYQGVIPLENSGNHRDHFLITFDATSSTVSVLDIYRLNLPANEVARFEPAGDGDLLEVVWTEPVGEDEYSFSVGQFDAAGALLSSTPFLLPVHHYPYTIFRLPDGGWIAGGLRSYSMELLTPPETSCDERPRQSVFGHLYAARFLPDGTLTGVSYFTSPIFDYSNSSDDASSVACDTGHVRYALDGEALLITGVYDRSSFFCAAAEPAATYRDEPVHACGVYLVRLDPRI